MTPINCYLLDDQIHSVERLKSLLQLNKHVNIAGELCDPEKAIGQILQVKPDIVFVDVEMPRLSGFQVVEEIRNKLFFPKFIFVTAYDQYAIKAIRAGAFDYILKPIDVDDLNDALERFLESRKHFSLPKGCCLTQREKEVVELVTRGKTSKEIGELLHLSKHTVDTHRRKVLEKLNIDSITELAVKDSS
jgi:DNA-binding NarL/FixJ family response regulator